MEFALGIVGVATWCSLVLWGMARIAISVWRRGEWKPTQATGLIAIATLSAGIILMLKNALPFETFGVGFVFTAISGIVLWAVGHAADN